MKTSLIAVSLIAFAMTSASTLSDVLKPSLHSSVAAMTRDHVSDILGRENVSYHVSSIGPNLRAANAQQKLTAEFATTGVEIRRGSLVTHFSLRGYGYGDALIAAKAAEAVVPRNASNHVEYDRGTLTEWYANGPAGLEQGFTIKEKPGKPNGDSLAIAMSITGDLRTVTDPSGGGVKFMTREGEPALWYEGLLATDAAGRELASQMYVRGDEIWIRVNDLHAQYPVTVDPSFQLAELTASDGEPDDNLGFSVSISGNTVVAGAPYATVNGNAAQGAVYVFVEPEGRWVNLTQTAKLTESSGAAGDNLGYSVSISGNTIVAGAPNATVGENLQQGAAYVFVMPPGGWVDSTETAELIASDGFAADLLGYSVAISGPAIVAGAPEATVNGNQNQGAGYEFTMPPTGWASGSQTAKFTASDGIVDASLGWSAALDGQTAVLGAPVGGPMGHGSAYVFVEPNDGWMDATQTAELTALGISSTANSLGFAVAVNGNTVVAGAPYSGFGQHLFQGSAYVYIADSNGWTNMDQTATFVVPQRGAAAVFGSSVAITKNTIIVGSPGVYQYNPAAGSVYGFIEPKTGWKTMAPTFRLTASDGVRNNQFGYAVAASGTTGVVGAFNQGVGANASQGSAYVFGNQ